MFHVEHGGSRLIVAAGVVNFSPPAAVRFQEHSLGRIIAIANQKGGVGKTTTAVNLAAALAMAEKQTLLIDLDPQANTTRGMGVTRDDEGPGTYEWLSEDGDADGLVRATELSLLSLVPSGRDLAGIEVELVGREGREYILRRRLEALGRQDQFVIIDCPPSLGLLTLNALAAADSVLIPVQTEYLALEGIAEMMGTLDRVRQAVNPSLAIEGVLLTMYDDRTNLAHQVVEEVRRVFGDGVFKTVIPRNVRLSEAPSFGQPIMLYDVRSKGSEAYLALAVEVLGNEQAQRPG